MSKCRIMKCANMKAPKVSVIIPCYNVELYIEETLQSIQKQTLQDIEIICVNDGSQDDTEKILMQLAEEDSRITVMSQENAGQGSARNRGVEWCSGECLYFMDADDLLEDSALEELYEAMNDRQLDVLYFDGTSFFESDQLEQEKASYKDYYTRKADYTGVVTGLDMLCLMMQHKEYRHSPCLQMIRHDYFVKHELWYLEQVYHEDNCFTFQTMIKAGKVGHINKPFFRRRIRDNSVMTGKPSFKHVYGYFVNYRHMVAIAEQIEIPQEQQQYVAKVLQNAITNARKGYRALEKEEQEKYKGMAPLEQGLFYDGVVACQYNNKEYEQLQSKYNKIKKNVGYRLFNILNKTLKKVFKRGKKK